MQRLAMPPPEHAVSFEEILGGLERDVLPFVARISHPGYLAFIPGEGTWPGALGDLIASALNVDTCWWLGSSGPERAGTRGARLVPAVGGLSRGVRRRARLGRLGGEPDGAGLRARGAYRRDGRPGGRVPVRSDALVRGASGASARLPARPGACDSHRRPRPHASGCPRRRHRSRPGRWATSPHGRRQRGHHGSRRRRPAA